MGVPNNLSSLFDCPSVHVFLNEALAFESNADIEQRGRPLYAYAGGPGLLVPFLETETPRTRLVEDREHRFLIWE